MAIKLIREKEPGPGTLGRTELYALALGQVIGAGVITLIVPAIKMTGYSAWLAYFAAIIVGFIMVSPNVFMASVVRMAGGNYSMLSGIAGPTYSGIFAYAYLTQCLSLSLFGVSAASYLGDLIPALSGTVPRILVGGALMTFFYVVNLTGINLMAKVQKLMTWLLIGSLLMFAVVGIVRLRLPVFDMGDPEFLVNGWGITFENGQISGGFLGAVLLFVYSCNGYYMSIAYGRDAKNARRDLPAVMMMVVPSLMVLYVGVAIAATGALTAEEYGQSTTLVFAAQRILPPVLFYVFIIGGPIMALLTSLNGSFANYSITIGQSCDDGWLPRTLGSRNKHNARVWVLTILYISGMIPIVFNFSIEVITNMAQLITSYLGFLNFVAYIKMPKIYSEAWKKSRFHLPNGIYYTICLLSLVIYIVVLWKALLSMSAGLAAANMILILVLTGIGFWRSKTGNVEIHTSVWAEKGMDPNFPDV